MQGQIIKPSSSPDVCHALSGIGCLPVSAGETPEADLDEQLVHETFRGENGRMKNQKLTLTLVILFIFAAASSAMATITGISSDGCAGTTCQPSFVAPIVAGKNMSVTIKGQYVDLSTGVEISGSGVTVSFGDRVHGSDSHIVVKFDVDAGASLTERTVKLHYAVETNGPDTFKVRVVRGGRVDQIQQKVAFANAFRLIAPNSIPVNQRVTLVFTGNRLGDARIALTQAVKNPQTLAGCSETRCEIEMEFTKSGNVDVNLFDANVGSADTLALNGTLFRFFYAGAKQVNVVGQANPSPTVNIVHPIAGSTTSTNPPFIDVAPGANLGNLFRGTGNSVTVEGINYLQVEDHWCQDNGVQTPAATNPPNFKDITIPDLTWRVSNVGTAATPVAFDSQLLSNGVVLQTQSIGAGTLSQGATRDFNFHRATSTVRVFRLAPPNQSGCFIKPNAGATLFFVDPGFTVKVDVGRALAETQANQSNNSRNY